jgi:hypothetical protein
LLAPDRDGKQAGPDKQLSMASHFPLNDVNSVFMKAIDDAEYAKDYPLVNVATADLVVFHCKQTVNRGPWSAGKYLEKLQGGKLISSYNKNQEVALLMGGFNEVMERATTQDKSTRIERLEKFSK